MHKKRSSPLSFIIYMLKRAFYKDNSAKHNMGSIDAKNFKWKHNTAIHRSFVVEFIKICRYKTFWKSFHLNLHKTSPQQALLKEYYC